MSGEPCSREKSWRPRGERTCLLNEIMPKKFFSVFLVGALLLGSLTASEQTRKSASSGSGRAAAWTGVVMYTRTQTQSDNKTVERVSGRGKDTRNWEMKFDYKAMVGVIEDPERNGLSAGKASITHSFTSKDTNVAVEKNSCDRGKTWQEMTGTFVSETTISGQGKEDANVHVGVNSDGTYSVSVGIPQIKGTVAGSQSSTFSGQCTPKEAKRRTMPPSPTTIQGQSLTSDGTHRVDPNDPYRLAGSYSLTLPGGVVETITWNLQKNATELRIIDLEFEDMKYPNWDDWQPISEQTGTVDGNWVKIKATVFNGSGETKTGEVYLKETYKGDKWDGARPDVPLKDQTFTVTLDAGEQRELEMLWDSSGYAWFDDGRPRLVQRIKAEAWENYRKVDEMTKNLKVRPKPIVLVPGIWSNRNHFEIYQNLFTTTHSYGWKAMAVVDTSSHGRIAGEGTTKPSTANRTVYALADNLTTYVHEVRGSLNAWHIDMLAHSTGGLVARLYVHKQMEILPDNHPVIKHLMLMGTPNNGVPCADSMGYNDAFRDSMQTAKELMPDEIALFNKYVTQRKGTKFSALVGNSVPILCTTPQWNDGFVSVESAKYGIEDVTFTSAMHPNMVSTENFNGYVRAHVVVGPRGTYPHATAAQK
jgi:pimeloyl-ACP methyl ester carboxylesterase